MRLSRVIALVKKKMVRARRGITGAQEPSIGGLALNCFNPFPLGDDGAFTHNTDAPSTPVIWHDDPTQQPYRPFVFTMESSAVTSIAVAADGARLVGDVDVVEPRRARAVLDADRGGDAVVEQARVEPEPRP